MGEKGLVVLGSLVLISLLVMSGLAYIAMQPMFIIPAIDFTQPARKPVLVLVMYSNGTTVCGKNVSVVFYYQGVRMNFTSYYGCIYIPIPLETGTEIWIYVDGKLVRKTELPELYVWDAVATDHFRLVVILRE